MSAPGHHSESAEDATVPPSNDRKNLRADATIAPTTGDSATIHSKVVDRYEILEELGRGGMGVVYKAIDQNLSRPVALKMIVSGSFASSDDVVRFRQEAHAAAQLDHENIIPVYEVSDPECEYQFFSMKLIEGGSLENRREEFSEPRLAAELVIGIANGVRHAHERGILHRDLKPANILIDEDKRPVITDLGLAKSIGCDSGLTQTGMVMGTPGFMSPEQAAGHKDVTVAADVYSLGAILYWLITGLKPFRGDTQMDVIMKTIHSEADSIRLHKSNVDLDLDLICQKALRNDKSQRYKSVEELISDLQAWLAGEAISIRPPSVLELIQIWIRKNFRTLSIAIGGGAAAGSFIGLVILLVMIRQMQASQGILELLGEKESNWITRNFDWVSQLPNGFVDFLTICSVWTTIIIATLMISVLRPTRKESALAASLTAGLVAAAVAFSLSLGWSPLISSSIQSGMSDIELLAHSVWLNSDSERELTHQALQNRYPGIEQIDVREKGVVLSRKILLDQAIGIPRGIWEGIGITIFLGLLPVFFSAAFSGRLWLSGIRGFEHFGKSFEIGIYCSLLCLVLTKFFSLQTGFSPGAVVQFLVIAGFLAAIYICLYKMNWKWRVAGFLVANSLFFWGLQESGKVRSAGQLARFANTDAELKTATRYYEQRLKQLDDTNTRFQLALIYAYLEDDTNYKSQCDQLMSGFEKFYRPENADRVAKLCLLNPEQRADRSVALQLANNISQYEHSPYLHWFYFCRALAEVRQQNFMDALQWNIRSRASAPNSDDPNLKYLISTTYLVDTLAHLGLGDIEDAKSANHNAIAQPISDPNRIAWINRIFFEILRREIEETEF